VSRGKKPEENRENATERLQKGNNNRGETGDQRKESRKERRRRMHAYCKQMRITTRRVENTMKKVQGRIHACERGFQR
jgi:hypothetical protein